MAEMFCSRCRTVGLTASSSCHKCNTPLQVFNPCRHGQSLVSPANSWNQIQGKWDDHPIFEEVSQRLYEYGCCGAATHINEFIRTLLEMIDGATTTSGKDLSND
jgi:NADH:ubiquinone oxidoreductase subunit F (NADH-binding)